MTVHALVGSVLGGGLLNNAFSFNNLSSALRALTRAAAEGAFLTAGFFGLGAVLVAALVVFFVVVLGFRPTAFLPAAVLGPGFEDVDALVDRLAGVRPV